MQSTARKSLVSVSYDNSSLITLMTSAAAAAAAAAAADDEELNSRCLVYSRQYTAVHQRTVYFIPYRRLDIGSFSACCI